MTLKLERLENWRQALTAQHNSATLAKMPRWQRFILVPGRVGFAVGQDILSGQITLRAMSLVYTTLLALVPLLAISFSVLKAFGVHNQIEPVLAEFLDPLGERGQEITAGIIGFVDNIDVGVLGFLGFLFLFYAVISLLQKVESSLNYIWQVPVERTLGQKLRDYFSAVIIGPVLIIAAMGVIASMMGSGVMRTLGDFGPMTHLIDMAERVVSLALVVGIFTFLLLFLPNTRVRFLPALIGGIVAAALWSVIGWGFATFVARSANYTVIYSAFAALFLFIIWLYLVWLIVMVGSAVAFYVQNPHYIGIRREAARYGIALTERVALIVAHHIVRAWYRDEGPASANRLARVTGAPMPVLLKVLAALEAAGIIGRTGESRQDYLPARPPEDTPLKAVLDAVRTDEGVGHPPPAPLAQPADVDQVLARIDGAVAASLADISLKDFAGTTTSTAAATISGTCA
jgi:membrane protein